MPRPERSLEPSAVHREAQLPGSEQSKLSQKRKNVSRACDLCRKRRTKCDAAQPCAQCQKADLECTYEEGVKRGDLRSQRLRIDEYEKLSRYGVVLQRLIQSIREGTADSVLQRIREGAGLSELFDALEPNDGQMVNSTTTADDSADFDVAMDALDEHGPGVANNQDLSASQSSARSRDWETWHPDLRARFVDGEEVIGRESPSSSSTSDPARTRYVPPPVSSDNGSVIDSSGFSHNNDAIDDSDLQQEQSVEFSRSFNNMPLSSSVISNGYSHKIDRHQLRNFELSEYLLLPLIQYDTSPLGRVYLDFLLIGRRLLRAQRSSLVLGKDNEVELLIRKRQPGDPFTASTWSYELNRSFSKRFSVATLLASCVIMTRLMRRMLLPCAETYAQIPSIMRPSKLQRLVPHPASIDLVLFADMRDAMIQDTRDFVRAYTYAGLDVSWPHFSE